KGFFEIIYQSINPATKNEATKKQIKTKIMFICYQLAAIRNKQVSDIKSSIGLFMSGCGTSATGIDSFAGMGLSSTYQTVFNKINAPAITINSSNIHNPNGVDAGLLKSLLKRNFSNIICESYV